ncbi:Protein SMG9 [Trichinella spiralis]|uniref:Protein SMG9 n=1 Tax=Trichinella spiralis TaxID=6334 RepID=A0A0V1BKN2_TRISP|nr:Protein SMG9 [Trichinella spiralis]
MKDVSICIEQNFKTVTQRINSSNCSAWIEFFVTVSIFCEESAFELMMREKCNMDRRGGRRHGRQFRSSNFTNAVAVRNVEIKFSSHVKMLRYCVFKVYIIVEPLTNKEEEDPLLNKPFVLLTKSALRVKCDSAGHNPPSISILKKLLPVKLDSKDNDTVEAILPSIVQTGNQIVVHAYDRQTYEAPKFPTTHGSSNVGMLESDVPASQLWTLYKSENKTSTERIRHFLRAPAAAVPLITENMQWCEQFEDYLDDQCKNFFVVGVIGPRGVGKSTLMSMIGGNYSSDMYSKETTESMWYQTAGVQIYVNRHRTILLDSEPIPSIAVMRNSMRAKYRNKSEASNMLTSSANQSLSVAAFLLQVCHLVIVLFESFVDADLMKFLLSAEEMKPTNKLTEQFGKVDRMPHIVFIQNKARGEDFEPDAYLKKSELLKEYTKNTSLNCTCDFSMPKYVFRADREQQLKINLYILPNIKPRGYKPEGISPIDYRCPEYDDLMKDLIEQINYLRKKIISTHVSICAPHLGTHKVIESHRQLQSSVFSLTCCASVSDG